MNITIWKLAPGNKEGQETVEQKRQKGLEYIEELKRDPTIKKVEFEDEGHQLKIKIWNA